MTFPFSFGKFEYFPIGQFIERFGPITKEMTINYRGIIKQVKKLCVCGRDCYGIELH